MILVVVIPGTNHLPIVTAQDAHDVDNYWWLIWRVRHIKRLSQGEADGVNKFLFFSSPDFNRLPWDNHDIIILKDEP